MKTIDIEDYFSEENEKKGVWYEPLIGDKPCGLKFLLIGIHSDEAVEKMEKIEEQAQTIKASELSDSEKEKKLDELDAERVAVLTKDIKASDGSALRKDGKPFKFSTEIAKEIYIKSPLLKIANVEFVLERANYMNIHK